MGKQKMSAGVIVSLLSAVLAIVSLIVYNVNISGAGYFEGASVSNTVLLCVASCAMLVVAALPGLLSIQGGGAKAADILSGLLRIAAPALLALCLINVISARIEGLGFIYFSNAEVLKEVQTAENLSSATMAIASMVCLGVAMISSIVAAFCPVTKD